MAANIYEFPCFLKRGEKSRNYCIYTRRRGSGHAETHQKSIENLFKINAGKNTAKVIDNYAKIEPKWEPKSIKN